MRKFCLLFLVIFGMGTACSYNKPQMPVLGTLPEFHLVNEKGNEFGLKNLQGKVWVANFIFTSCAGTCPLLTQRMKRVQEAILDLGAQGQGLQIVSFSVDPERDTPERLAEYAKNYGARPEVWSFVTGPMDQVSPTVVQGFKLAMGKVARGAPAAQPSEGEIFDVVHGEKFVLVDQEGRIRGYYDSDRQGITKLVRDMKRLL